MKREFARIARNRMLQEREDFQKARTLNSARQSRNSGVPRSKGTQTLRDSYAGMSPQAQQQYATNYMNEQSAGGNTQAAGAISGFNAGADGAEGSFKNFNPDRFGAQAFGGSTPGGKNVVGQTQSNKRAAHDSKTMAQMGQLGLDPSLNAPAAGADPAAAVDPAAAPTNTLNPAVQAQAQQFAAGQDQAKVAGGQKGKESWLKNADGSRKGFGQLAGSAALGLATGGISNLVGAGVRAGRNAGVNQHNAGVNRASQRMDQRSMGINPSMAAKSAMNIHESIAFLDIRKSIQDDKSFGQNK